ncbi:hypothetical protein AK812_SmicGene3163 [Symbiodinium microadriaticum]|uniref:Uncharacterized protein n=1 Tax=Symbiodinium microadriaticum TaxID=2951 RepID=A0A1Q9EZP9_SYMMI|nr:hypothetical protein AK812_SmicGene3163 [Symbiodinium microadriaticum]
MKNTPFWRVRISAQEVQWGENQAEKCCEILAQLDKLVQVDCLDEQRLTVRSEVVKSVTGLSDQRTTWDFNFGLGLYGMRAPPRETGKVY